MRLKSLSILALLLTAVSGAWAEKVELNKFWAWDQSAQQNTQSGSTYTFNSDWMGGSTSVYADWSAYDYVWMKYSGLSGEIKFIIQYDEYVSTESWGVVFDEESVTLNSADATSGFVRIAINKTKTFVTGGGDTGGEHIGDIYAKHVRELRIQNPTSPSSITVEGIWIGTEEDYNGAINETYDPTKNHMLKVYNSRITENIWDNVAQYTFATPMEAGKSYTIKMKVHAADITAPCTVRYGFIGEGTDYSTYVYGDDMTILPHTSAVFTDTYQAKVDHPTIEFSMGGVIGNVFFDDVSCTLADDESVNMIGNADFETQTYYGWSAPGYTMQSFSHVEDPYTELKETTDNSTWLSGNSEPANIRLDRTLQTGGWNTFCSPFSISSTDLTAMGITAKTLSSSTFDNATGKLTLNFANATSIEAGKPYLVKVNATVQNPTFENVPTVSTTTPTETTYVDFIPVMSPTNLTGGDKTVLFVSGGNSLTYPSGNGNINGFRAYFKLKDVAAAAAYTFDMSFDNTTGIQSVSDVRRQMSDAWYTLDGRKLQGQPTTKGVYIVNGKKTIIK
jgi:hypothetical protein